MVSLRIKIWLTSVTALYLFSKINKWVGIKEEMIALQFWGGGLFPSQWLLISLSKILKPESWSLPVRSKLSNGNCHHLCKLYTRPISQSLLHLQSSCLILHRYLKQFVTPHLFLPILNPGVTPVGSSLETSLAYQYCTYRRRLRSHLNTNLYWLLNASISQFWFHVCKSRSV